VEAVVLSGIQGSGKSTFFVERFFPTHVRISRDLLRTPHREAKFLELCLETRQPFVVDKINPTAADRRPYIEAARAAGYKTIAYWIQAETRDAIARNAARSGTGQVPVPAILGTHKKLVPPSLDEGFDEVWHAWADGRGGFHVEAVAGAGSEDRAASEERFVRGATAPR